MDILFILMIAGIGFVVGVLVGRKHRKEADIMAAVADDMKHRAEDLLKK